MSERVRNLGASEDAYTSICCCCGSECYDDNIQKVVSVDKTLTMCETCSEEAALKLKFDASDMSETEFHALDEHCKHHLILAFIPAIRQINDIQDVEEFFDALSAMLNWHPDTRFDEYVKTGGPVDAKSDYVGERTFTDAEAAELDKCMERCFKICDVVTKDKPDVYALSIESVRRVHPEFAKAVMGEEPTPTPAPAIIIEVSGGLVQSVYHHGHIPANLRVIVADLDNWKAGRELLAEHAIEELKDATDVVREAVESQKARVP